MLELYDERGVVDLLAFHGLLADIMNELDVLDLICRKESWPIPLIAFFGDADHTLEHEDRLWLFKAIILIDILPRVRLDHHQLEIPHVILY